MGAECEITKEKNKEKRADRVTTDVQTVLNHKV